MRIENISGKKPEALRKSSVPMPPVSKSPETPGIERAGKPGHQRQVPFRQLQFRKGIDQLIQLLDRTKPKHLSLIPLLNLMKELPSGPDGVPLNTKDRELLLRILILWKGENRLPPGSKADREYERILRILQDRGEPRFQFVQKPYDQKPGLTILEESPSSGNREEDRARSLEMRLSLNRLGEFRILLEQRGRIRSCLIFAEKDRSRREVKKAGKRLKNRILERGMGPVSLKIKSNPYLPDDSGMTDRKGVQLWG